jgi:Domain of unknown function (DUF4129)
VLAKVPKAKEPSTEHRVRLTDRHKIALDLLAMVGFVCAIAATSSSSSGSISDTAKRFIIELPNWLSATIVVLFSAATLLVLAFLVPRPHRRRKEDEPLELYYEPQKVRRRDVALLTLLASFPLWLSAGVFWYSRFRVADQLAGHSRFITGQLSRLPDLPTSTGGQLHFESNIVHSVAASGLIGTLALLSGVAAFFFALWLYFGDHLSRQNGTSPYISLPELQTTIEESSDNLHFEVDPRRAIIKYYRRFEVALAARGFPRAPYETATEYWIRLRQHRYLPKGALFEMTRLFELSRFSQHDLMVSDREIAWRSLAEIEIALELRGGDAPTR